MNISSQRLSKKGWIYRFADRLVEASDYEICLGEAVKLGCAEYERWSAASPEITVRRLVAACEHDRRQMAMREQPPLFVTARMVGAAATRPAR